MTIGDGKARIQMWSLGECRAAVGADHLSLAARRRGQDQLLVVPDAELGFTALCV